MALAPNPSGSSHSLSLAQRLPAIVLIDIAKCLRGLHPPTMFRSLWNITPKYAYMVRFLGVCRAWRSACHHLLFHEAWLGYEMYRYRSTIQRRRNSDLSTISDHYMSLKSIHDLGMTQFPTLLVMYTSVRCLTSSKSIKARAGMLSNIKLPNVADILICIYNSNPPIQASISRLRESTRLLAQSLHRMAPNANNVMIVSKSSLSTTWTYIAVETLFEQLSGIAIWRPGTRFQTWSTKGTYY